MALYTFYPSKPDGTSETFVCFDLPDDDEARIRAVHVLDQHPTAAQVVVWDGERKVAVRNRIRPDLRLVSSRD